MSEWLANVDLGKPPSDEEEAQSRFGIGWAEEAARAEAEAHQDFKDEEIVRAQFFTFQISTFDKSGFPRALVIAWKFHHSPYTFCIRSEEHTSELQSLV